MCVCVCVCVCVYTFPCVISAKFGLVFGTEWGYLGLGVQQALKVVLEEINCFQPNDSTVIGVGVWNVET